MCRGRKLQWSLYEFATKWYFQKHAHTQNCSLCEFYDEQAIILRNSLIYIEQILVRYTTEDRYVVNEITIKYAIDKI
jgi:hypothetical protein